MIFHRDFKFDKMLIHFNKTKSNSKNPESNAIFLILLNVKIPSPLERSKMKRAELFSKNGDSAHIFKSIRQM